MLSFMPIHTGGVSAPRDYTQTGDLNFTLTHTVISDDAAYGGGAVSVQPVLVTVRDADVAAVEVRAGGADAALMQLTVVRPRDTFSQADTRTHNSYERTV